MQLIAEHEYAKTFYELEPTYLAAPYGFFWNYLPTKKTRVLTSKHYVSCFNYSNYEIKTYENNHDKLAIGETGAMVGSWNFSLAHKKASVRRELVFLISKEEPVYCQLQEWFEEMWNNAHEVKPSA